MVTKIGNAVLKRNDKKMDKLNHEKINLAKRLKALPTKLSTSDEIEYKSIMDQAFQNEMKHNELQAEINRLYNIEQWLKYEEEK